ncbi:hypothetical protein PR048_013317 [Dryococelus australis]|uniref:Uncharacterized protein n=1 Tax=Dryococelus australis TaxID=614101 RepID=A0ABQ9HRT8_9NEOP|nr:hypothetical protein PR048_013317 [Dryococelus australis]
MVFGMHDLYHTDLVIMIPYTHVDKQFKYMQAVIHYYSKLTKNLQIDLGYESYNPEFQHLMKKHKIKYFQHIVV